MVRGLYTAALGMMSQMERMDVVSNNIANADTTGYKKDKVANQSFTETLMKRINDPGMRMFKNYPISTMSQGVFTDDIYTDFSSGSLKQTNNSLDVGLTGEGFFCVTVEGEEWYTRDGSFNLLPDGTLVTADGQRVQGLEGDIVLPNGNINIDEGGRILVNGEYVDTFKMVDFADKHVTMKKTRDNYYSANAPAQDANAAAGAQADGPEQLPFTGQVSQGFLENSNVNSVSEMVEMIALSRAYEANSRIITVTDATLQRAVNDIARR